MAFDFPPTRDGTNEFVVGGKAVLESGGGTLGTDGLTLGDVSLLRPISLETMNSMPTTVNESRLIIHVATLAAERTDLPSHAEQALEIEGLVRAYSSVPLDMAQPGPAALRNPLDKLPLTS